MSDIKRFIEELKMYSGNMVFNPWRDYDVVYDISKDAPAIRCFHLETYLRLRTTKTRYIFLAEALGYQGGHFSGIAMTSERILLGFHPSINPTMVIGKSGQRTSNATCTLLKKSVQERGFNEPTATIVWQAIIDNDIRPEEVVLWNIFPFHPYKSGGLLTNRTPTDIELEKGLMYLDSLRRLCSNAKVVCIGQKSFETMDSVGVKSVLRHPANGGAAEFRKGIKELLATY